jgi:hypothetical protein
MSQIYLRKLSLTLLLFLATPSLVRHVSAAMPPPKPSFRVTMLRPDDAVPVGVLPVILTPAGDLYDTRWELLDPSGWGKMLRCTAHPDKLHGPCRLFISVEQRDQMEPVLRDTLKKLEEAADRNRDTLIFVGGMLP